MRLLVERLVHQVPDAVEAAVVGELPRGAVGRDLVVLDPLCCPDQGRVLGVRVAFRLEGIVGLAETTSRYWVVGGRQEDPAAVSRRVAELAWAGLRGVRR